MFFNNISQEENENLYYVVLVLYQIDIPIAWLIDSFQNSIFIVSAYFINFYECNINFYKTACNSICGVCLTCVDRYTIFCKRYI